MSARDKNKKDAKFKVGDLIIDPNDVYLFVTRINVEGWYEMYTLYNPEYIDVYPVSVIDKNCTLVGKVDEHTNK